MVILIGQQRLPYLYISLFRPKVYHFNVISKSVSPSVRSSCRHSDSAGYLHD